MEQQNPQSTETYYKFKDIIFIRWLRNIFKTSHSPAGQRGFRPKEPLPGKPPRGIYGDLFMTDAFFNVVTLPKQNAALKEELAERTANLKTQLAKSRDLWEDYWQKSGGYYTEPQPDVEIEITKLIGDTDEISTVVNYHRRRNEASPEDLPTPATVDKRTIIDAYTKELADISRALSVPETKIGPIPRPPVKDIP